ncbi:MAG: hypothetical protein KDN22_24470 [Verrucomicrobiae bacterium]|nr:hypothetical protein [Verrucomicrobiae bacterium]
MKKIRQLLIWLVLVPLLLLGAAFFGLNYYLESRLKPEVLVALIESEKNCRVDISDCDVSILHQPAHVIMKGVTFLPRDSFAENATQLSERPPIEIGTTYIRCPEVILKVRLWDLLVRRLQVNELDLREPEVAFSLLRGGGNSLKPLFASLKKKSTSVDGIKMGEDKDKGKDDKLGGEVVVADGASKEELEKKPFHVSELPLQSTLRLAHLNGGVLKMLVEKSGVVIEVKIHDLSFSDIDVNPYDLEAGNTAVMNLDCTVAVDEPEQNLRYAEMHVGISGGITPFDAATGHLNPDMKYDVIFRQGSYVQSMPLMEKLGNSMDELQKIGLKLEELGQKEVLREDRQARVGYRDKRIRLLNELVLPFDNYQLTLEKQSWLETGDSEHEFRGNMLIAKELTAKALDGVEEYVRSRVGDNVADVARKLVDPIVEENQISLDFRSKGALGKPKIKIDNPLGDIKDGLKEKGKQLLNGTLQNLLNRGQ